MLIRRCPKINEENSYQQENNNGNVYGFVYDTLGCGSLKWIILNLNDWQQVWNILKLMVIG